MSTGAPPSAPQAILHRKIKIFGERNTGTRAVAQMLRPVRGITTGFRLPDEKSLGLVAMQLMATLEKAHPEVFPEFQIDIRVTSGKAVHAWKHSAPPIDGSYAATNASVLFLVRDPYSWIASFFRNPYDVRGGHPDTLAAFLKRPWSTMKRDNIGPDLDSPMRLWNEKLRAYLAFASAAPVPSTVLYFEAFVLEPVASLHAALARFGIAAEGLAELDGPTKPNGKRREARVRYYQTNAWEAEISPEAAALINHYVDWDVATSFGYHKRAPEAFGIK